MSFLRNDNGPIYRNPDLDAPWDFHPFDDEDEDDDYWPDDDYERDYDTDDY